MACSPDGLQHPNFHVQLSGPGTRASPMRHVVKTKRNVKKARKGARSPRGHPGSGQRHRALKLSLCAWLFGQNMFDSGHLVGQHRLHLMSLQIQLNLHLLLERLHLSCILLVIVLHCCFQTGLSGCQLVHLGFQHLQSLILVIDLHLVSGRQFGEDVLLNFPNHQPVCHIIYGKPSQGLSKCGWCEITIFLAIFCGDLPLHRPTKKALYVESVPPSSIGSWVMAIDKLRPPRFG